MLPGLRGGEMTKRQQALHLAIFVACVVVCALVVLYLGASNAGVMGY